MYNSVHLTIDMDLRLFACHQIDFCGISPNYRLKMNKLTYQLRLGENTKTNGRFYFLSFRVQAHEKSFVSMKRCGDFM